MNTDHNRVGWKTVKRVTSSAQTELWQQRELFSGKGVQDGWTACDAGKLNVLCTARPRAVPYPSSTLFLYHKNIKM